MPLLRQLILSFGLITLLLPTPCLGELPQESQSLLGEAERLLAQQQPEDALEILEELHEAAPSDRRVTHMLARVRSYNQDLDGALALYDSLLGNDFSDPGMQIERARVLAWMGNLEESQNSMTELTQESPTAVDAWAVLADGHLWSGDREAARDQLRKGLGASPESPVLLSRLARLEYLSDRVGNARRLLHRATGNGSSIEEISRRLALYSRWIAQGSISHEQWSDSRSMRTITTQADWRPEGPWSGQVTLEQVVRLGREEYSSKLHFRRTIRGGVILGAGATAAPGAELLPRIGGRMELDWSPLARWKTDFGVRVLRFSSGTANVLRVGVTRWMGAELSAGYRLDWARDVDRNHDWAQMLRLQWAPSPWTRASIDLFHGTDAETIGLTADARTITMNGISSSMRFYLSQRWGMNLQAGYADQRGSGSRRTFGLGVLHHL